MPTPLNQQTGMPQMVAAFSGWETAMTWKHITQTVVDGFPVDDEKSYTVSAVFQPMTAEEIQLKPDAQWSWSWYMLHIRTPAPTFQTNDRVEYNGTRYKIMSKKDYSLNGYIQYDIILDYQGE